MRETTKTKKDVFKGRVLHLEVHDIELENGDTSIREIIRHPGAIGVVARRPDGMLLLVKQFRKAVEDYHIEIVAGLLDPDEDPDDCVRRELKEETGYEAAKLVRLGDLHASPGYTSEHVRIYYAEVEGEPAAVELDEDEHVEPVVMTEDDFLKAVRTGRITDSKTLASWLLYEQVVRRNTEPEDV